MIHLKNPTSGSDIGLASNRGQAIIWSKDGFVTDAYMRFWPQ